MANNIDIPKEMILNHKNPVHFEQWSKLFYQAYGMNAMYGMAFIFMAANRDVVLKEEGTCPHFYAFGKPGSGKSQMLKSMTCFFYGEQRSSDINRGIQFYYNEILTKYRNKMYFLDDLEESSLTPYFSGCIKRTYDNEARGFLNKKANKAAAPIVIQSALSFAGQNLIQDKWFLNKCIIREFKGFEGIVQQKQIDAYNELKDLESNGRLVYLLNDLTDFRAIFKKDFSLAYQSILLKLLNQIDSLSLVINERIMRNYCFLLASTKLANGFFNLPFEYEDFYVDVIKEINHVNAMIEEIENTKKGGVNGK